MGTMPSRECSLCQRKTHALTGTQGLDASMYLRRRRMLGGCHANCSSWIFRSGCGAKQAFVSLVSTVLFDSEITTVKARGPLFATLSIAGGCRATQEGKKGQKSAPAMAERKLGFEIDLGHGAVKFRQEEEGIVAKTAGASRCFENEAFD